MAGQQPVEKGGTGTLKEEFSRIDSTIRAEPVPFFNGRLTFSRSWVSLASLLSFYAGC